MRNIAKLFGIAVIMAVIGASMVACKNDDDGKGQGGTILDGTWKRSSGSHTYQFNLSGNNWVYSEDGDEWSKGTWSSSNTPAAGSTGSLTLTATHYRPNFSGSWQDFPSSYDSVKTNTATYTINADGNILTISNPALTTSGVWGTLAGTYTKQ
jgi:hypothetical protein